MRQVLLPALLVASISARVKVYFFRQKRQTASALPVDKFAFYAFPPVKSGRRKQFFERIAAEDKTVFFYESVHRIAKTLNELAEYLGPDTPVALIREATKLHEEVRRGTASELAADPGTLKGEFVIGVGRPHTPESSEQRDEG